MHFPVDAIRQCYAMSGVIDINPEVVQEPVAILIRIFVMPLRASVDVNRSDGIVAVETKQVYPFGLFQRIAAQPPAYGAVIVPCTIVYEATLDVCVLCGEAEWI